MKLTKKDLNDLFKELNVSQKHQLKIENEKQKTINNNLKKLALKSKELNKNIPTEVSVVVSMNQPVGMWFFDKYREWVE